MPTAYARPVPWERMRREQFLLENECWLTCNGGFCCNHSHPDFQFQLIPTHGSTILYMEDEYHWLAENALIPDPQTPEGVTNLLSIDFGGPRPLSLVQLHCRLLGKCQGKIDKPLLCKLYPMLPVLGVDGDLEDIAPSSIFELTMQLRGMQTPCTVVDKKRQYWDRWKNAPEHLESLRHPVVILYLRAARHFAEIYSEKLRVNDALDGLSGKQFWRMWELEYLMGGLMDADLLAARIRQTHDELVERYGDFFERP